MVHKIIDEETLKNAGYHTIRRYSHLPSYCEVCKKQRTHRCTGIKGKKYRFECIHCKERLRTPRYR